MKVIDLRKITPMIIGTTLEVINSGSSSAWKIGEAVEVSSKPSVLGGMKFRQDGEFYEILNDVEFRLVELKQL